MKIHNYFYGLTIAFCFCMSLLHAQELQANVTILTSRVNSSTNPKIFNTLQAQLTSFLNARRWTDDNFRSFEKIKCNFFLNLQDGGSPNVYNGTLIVQAMRPVYHSSYLSPIINFQDGDVVFKYIEFQSIDFNDNRVSGTDPLISNLAASFAYYAYLIIGTYYDSFGQKAGEPYFLKMYNIVLNAPDGSGIRGWKQFDGLRNRYWLSDNLQNTRYNNIHDIIYGYYRLGLDNLNDKPDDARANTVKVLNQLLAFSKDNPNTMIQEFFMASKVNELSGIFASSATDDKSKVLSLLTQLDAGNADKYKAALQ